MWTDKLIRNATAAVVILAAASVHAQGPGCEGPPDVIPQPAFVLPMDVPEDALTKYAPPLPIPSPPSEVRRDPVQLRVLKYAAMALKHKLTGLASYYSTSLDGGPTATGEVFRNAKFTAAHLTLPLGSWIEITSRATGKKIRCRVNDRGPYAHRFMLDLSQAAARALGVDRAEDRHVFVRVIALPGESPLPEDWEAKVTAADLEPRVAEEVVSRD